MAKSHFAIVILEKVSLWVGGGEEEKPRKRINVIDKQKGIQYEELGTANVTRWNTTTKIEGGIECPICEFF